jgi:hypothetical protein
MSIAAYQISTRIDPAGEVRFGYTATKTVMDSL